MRLWACAVRPRVIEKIRILRGDRSLAFLDEQQFQIGGASELAKATACLSAPKYCLNLSSEPELRAKTITEEARTTNQATIESNCERSGRGQADAFQQEKASRQQRT